MNRSDTACDAGGISRRRFLAASATAAGVASFHAISAAEDKPVRIGIVGVGQRGSSLVRTLLRIPGVEVTAVGDIVAERAAASQQVVQERIGRRPVAYTAGDRDFERLVIRDDVDAVITATPWEWHVPVMVAAMKAGKYGGVEVPAATTLEECWELVETSERTGVPCMILENVCYTGLLLVLLRMVREGVFGDLLCLEAGYEHDVRNHKISAAGELLWRGVHSLKRNGNLYPTHPIGPMALYLDINRGDRFKYLVSMSTPSRGLRNYAAETLGPDHELAKLDYALGDVNTTLIKTEQGRTLTLWHDTNTPRPRDVFFRVQGTKGIFLDEDHIYIDKASPKDAQGHPQWESFASYGKHYPHPLWESLKEAALADGGHGGGDYVCLREFVEAVRRKAPVPLDVYDAAAWSAIVPLSCESVAKGSAPAEFPDFTRGKWKTSPPFPIKGA